MNDRTLDNALGRALWTRSSRLGANVSAKTSSEVDALGRGLRQELENAGFSREQIAAHLAEAAKQADAGVRGAADVFTFGNSAELAAGMDAFLGRGDGEDFKSRYRSNLQNEEQRDNYDSERRGTARAAGQVAATGLLYLGSAGGVNTQLSRLPPAKKGVLGENLSALKSTVLLDRPVQSQVRVPLSKGYTRADHMTRSGRVVESKFGPKATLSGRQRQAVDELGPAYRVDRWLSEHVSRPIGVAISSIGLATSDHDRRRR